MNVNFNRFQASLFSCLALLTGIEILSASEKDTIGLTDLLARKPGADGSGIRVGQVEAGIGYQANPAAAGQPASKFSFFDNDATYPVSGVYEASKVSSHANNVANNFYDVNTGVATDVPEIYIFSANIFYNDLVTSQIDTGCKVVNQSFVFPALSAIETANVQNDYDDYADRFQTLFVNGANNGSTTEVALPGTMYNGITVGREDLNSSTGPTYDGRSKPDMIGPGSASSYSTPYVAGAAAVLIEAGLAGEGGTGTASDAADIRTVKALILNGAVKDAAWSHTATAPLDTRRGAGMLQLDHSYQILEGGQHGSTSGSHQSSSGGTHIPSSAQVGNVASNLGWDFRTITNSVGVFSPTRERVENYYFDHASVKDVVATLTWNKQRNKNNINNLDLYLYDADTGAVVDSSVSTLDNVEHIYSRNLPTGRYVLQVVKRLGNKVSNAEDYALAFRFSDPAPLAPSAITATSNSTSTIDLTWVDNSTDELNFELQRSGLSSRAFDTVAVLPADTLSYTDTGLATGTRYYYRVKATNLAGDSFYSNVSNARTLTQLENWRFINYGISNNTGAGADGQDPDNDGLINLMEYALGTDPNIAESLNGGMAQPQASVVEVSGDQYLEINVVRAEKKSDLNYIVEVSDDLEGRIWVAATDIILDTGTTLRVRDNVAINSSGAPAAKFIRLRVELKSN